MNAFGHSEYIGGNNLLNTLQTMKALLLYVAIGFVAVNVAANSFQSTAEGIKSARQARNAQLCMVSPQYCA